jgi:hypothetical protein
MLPAATLMLQILAATAGSAPSEPSGPSEPAEGEPPVAPPASSKADTTYGRIDGDIGLVIGVGVTVGPDAPRGSVDFRVRYLETAGLFLTYEEGGVFGSGAEPVRVFGGGLEIRPLFLGRWLTGRESGHPRLDLAIDSLGFELGGFFAQPQGEPFAESPGLQAGLGLELPLLERASGPWIGLHGGIRFSANALGGGPTSDPADRAFFLSITLAWHQIVGAHIVDPFDRAPR